MADDPPATFSERFPETVGAQSESELRQAAAAYSQGQYARAISAGLSGLVAGAGETIAGLFTKTSDAFFKGLTPSQEIEIGVNAALTQIGGGVAFKIPNGTAAAFDNFHDQVIKPTAQSFTGAPTQVEPPKNTDVPPSVSRSQLALTGEPHVDAILQSPVTKSVIDNPIVDRTHDVPYTAGGSVPLQDPTVFIDKNFPRAFNIDGKVFDPADPFTVHENVEQHTMDILTKGGMDDATAYKVAHFEFAEKAEGAWYDAHGIDQAKAEAAYRPYMDAIQREQGNDYPPNLYDRPYPHDQPSAAKNEAIAEPRPTPAEIDRAKQIIADWQQSGGLTSEFPGTVPAPEAEAPRPITNPLQEAHELGVVGADRPDPLAGSPREAAAAATQDRLRGPTPEQQPTPWRQRWEKTLDKMQVPADARRVISAIVDANGEFQPARQGDMSPADIEKLGLVTGLDTTKIDVAGTSSKIKNNAEMRNTIEAFRTVNAKIKEAANAVREKNGVGDEAERGEMARLELQRDLLLEATTTTKELIALRAEFGRAGNLLNEYQKALGETNGLRDFLRDKMGTTADNMRERARLIADTDDRALPKVLNPNARVKPTPWYFWTWQNLLISGLITHTKYAIVNTAQTVLDRTFAPFVSAVIDKSLGREASLAAPVWSYASMIHAFPDALRGAGEAFKTGERVPLISEMELAERGQEAPSGQAVPYQTGNKVDWGIWKKVFNEEQLGKAERAIGTFGRSANALHTFYKILNERSSLGMRAYQEAFKEKPTTNADFWQRYEYHYANPTDDVLRAATADGYEGTFMGRMGEGTTKLAGALKGNPLTRWLFPFMHIPLEIARTSVRYSPLAAFGPEMRAQLMGQRGQAAQSLALAKVVIGTTAISYFAARALNGEMTGSYPVNPKERARWRVMGLQPNSIAADGEWHSMDRLGPIGILAGYSADLAHIWQHYDVNDENAMAKAVAGLGIAFANSIANDVGFQSIRNIIDVLDGQQKPERFLSYEESTFLVPSLVRQAASFNDPEMRNAGNLIDGLKYSLPFAREDLMPKRDPLYGTPAPNPGYGTLGRNVPIQRDYAKSELDRIGYYPTAPANHIGGVKLTPQQYDKYEATAGPLVKAALNGLVRSPQWQAHNTNPEWQKEVAKSVISAARRKAAGAMQMDDPNLIEAGRQRRLTQINNPR